MSLCYLSNIVIDKIFTQIFKSLTKKNFFEIILKLREINNFFEKRCDNLLFNFFSFQYQGPFIKIENKDEARSVFLENRLRHRLLQKDDFFAINCNFRDCLICNQCNEIITDYCYQSEDNSVFEIDDPFKNRTIVNIEKKIICWNCYSTECGNIDEHEKLEDCLSVCDEVDIFIRSIM